MIVILWEYIPKIGVYTLIIERERKHHMLIRISRLDATMRGIVYTMDIEGFEDFIKSKATGNDEIDVAGCNINGIARQFIRYEGMLTERQWAVMQAAFTRQA